MPDAAVSQLVDEIARLHLQCGASDGRLAAPSR
jgi:hypothetical protein